MKPLLILLFIALTIGIFQSEDIYTFNQAFEDIQSFFSLITDVFETK